MRELIRAMDSIRKSILSIHKISYLDLGLNYLKSFNSSWRNYLKKFMGLPANLRSKVLNDSIFVGKYAKYLELSKNKKNKT